MSEEMSVLDLLRQTKKGYHPAQALLELSEDVDATVPDRINCHRELLKYCAAQKKSVEAKVDLNAEMSALRIVIDTGEGEDKELEY